MSRDPYEKTVLAVLADAAGIDALSDPGTRMSNAAAEAEAQGVLLSLSSVAVAALHRLARDFHSSEASDRESMELYRNARARADGLRERVADLEARLALRPADPDQIKAAVLSRICEIAGLRGEAVGAVADVLIPAIDRLSAERDEADRRAGAAERQMVSLRDTVSKRRQWTDDRKEERGFHTNVSFDRVWEEVTGEADRVPELVADVQALCRVVDPVRLRADARAEEAFDKAARL